jgi:hypothetical protein
MDYLSVVGSCLDKEPVGTVMVISKYFQYENILYYQVVQYTNDNGGYGVIAECSDCNLADKICKMTKSIINHEKGCPLCGEGG